MFLLYVKLRTNVERGLDENAEKFQYGGGGTASRLELLREGSLLLTTKFPEIPGTPFIDLGKIELTLEPPRLSGFENGTTRLGIQHLNH